MSKLNNKYKLYTKAVAYSILGSYIRGAASESAILSSRLTNKMLGKRICKYGLSESAHIDPLDLKVDLNNYLTYPDKINYINNLITYAKESMSEMFTSINAVRNLSEDEKILKLKDVAAELATDIGKVAFSEGSVDEELKSDIRLILKEGKERFEKRAKDSRDQAAGNLETMDAPDLGEDEKLAQDPMADNEQMDGQTEDPGVDLGMNDSFDDESGNDDTVEYDGDGSMGGDLDKAGDAMAEFEDKDDQTAKEESFLIDKFNTHTAYAENFKYDHNGIKSTMSKEEVDKIVDELMSFEDDFFTAVTRAEGLDIVNTQSYKIKSKYAVNEIAVILTARQRLNMI